MSNPESAITAFSQLGLEPRLIAALDDVGYETPTAIQIETIPMLLAGRDLIGQAQTGTGKTAAFALPILQQLRPDTREVQALVLTPTRELAIQVAEAFQRYANHLQGFHVLPIYGGQDYGVQLRALKRGVQVVVGTPGRVMDHMRRNTLKLGGLRYLVLDEGDEMLRMGFIDDIEWILEQTPAGRLTALFSATMPPPIRKIAERYLTDPAEISVRVTTTTAPTIRQRYWVQRGLNKLDALTRILESEDFAGVLIFVRTKIATIELSERLEARGYACSAINGDMPQRARERTIEQLKDGTLDILVATDVAARGLDVERVSHVVNFDIPYDPEAYVHRIGRTGRAGRHGEAILFVMPRETRMLRLIEKVTRQSLEEMELPSTEHINDNRRARFLRMISETLAAGGLEVYRELVERFQREHDADPLMIAAALARIQQGDEPLLLEPPRHDKGRKRPPDSRPTREYGAAERNSREPGTTQREAREPAPMTSRPPFASTRHESDDNRPPRPERRAADRRPPDSGMERYRIEVGHAHEVGPGNIVGAIANEAGLDAKDIGRIDIEDEYSTVDLPQGMPREVFKHLQRVWVSGRQLRISRLDDPSAATTGPRPPREPATKARPRKKLRHKARKNKGAPSARK